MSRPASRIRRRGVGPSLERRARGLQVGGVGPFAAVQIRCDEGAVCAMCGPSPVAWPNRPWPRFWSVLGTGQLTLDDSDLMLVAALAGEGLAFLSDIAAAKSIEAGLLLPVLEDWSPGISGSLSLLSEPPQYSGPAARVSST